MYIINGRAVCLIVEDSIFEIAFFYILRIVGQRKLQPDFAVTRLHSCSSW